MQQLLAEIDNILNNVIPDLRSQFGQLSYEQIQKIEQSEKFMIFLKNLMIQN